jgi:hypothetical protein
MTFAKWTRPHFKDDAETWSETDQAPTLNGWEERHEVSPVAVLTSSMEAGLVKETQWPVSGPVFPMSAAVCGMRSDGCCENCDHDGSSVRMFPDYLASIADSISSGCSWTWMNSGTVSLGAVSMRVGSESPSGAAVSSLSAVFGNAARAAQVLAVCESCGGHPSARGQERQDVAPTLDDGARGAGDGHGNAWNSTYIADDIAPTLDDGARRASAELPLIAAATQSGGGHSNGVNLPGRHHEDDENLVVARGQTSRNERIDAETENLLVASPDRASDGHHGFSSGRSDGADNLIAQTLNGSYAKTTASAGSHGSGAPVNDVHGSHGVRRLTPLECERLQGWPDEHTRYGADGKEISDSHRYRLIGNGVASPVAEWIGHRLVAVDAMMRAEAIA